MTSEEKLSLEQAFVENYLDFGDDYTITQQNLKKVNDLYLESYKKAEKIATDLSDGLILDQCDAILSIQTLCLTEKYKSRLEEELKLL